eukprot:TRINITY_DN12182_c0_g2_i1.p1 TRINITY_DN12182_c0_g2~~TRINITY_DN12182_c0_g2_i1.p1  ORF type:complete len:671 (-),score=121.77 TRINITY_DN12182_c0_g2_i1:271-2085(-)
MASHENRENNMGVGTMPSPESAEACAENIVSNWLSGALRSEREALAKMLEASHQDILADFSRTVSSYTAFSDGAREDVRLCKALSIARKVEACPTSEECSRMAPSTACPTSEGCSLVAPCTETKQELAIVEAPKSHMIQKSKNVVPFFRDGSPAGNGASSKRDEGAKRKRKGEGKPRVTQLDVARLAAKMSPGNPRAMLRVNGSVLRRAVTSFDEKHAHEVPPVFEFVIFAVIASNALIMGLERQYESFDVGASLGVPGFDRGVVTWPHASIAFQICELVIGMIFILEVLVLGFWLRCHYLCSAWRVFDLIIVLSWIVFQLGNVMDINPTILRVTKLVRMVRLTRVLRAFSVCDPLQLLVKAVLSSFAVLFWSLILLSCVVLIVVIFLGQLLDSWVNDASNLFDDRVEVFMLYGSFTRAVETILEVTLGNWGPPCRLLQNKVSEWWVLFFVFYKFIIGFAVVQVIISVFIQQTFKVVARDEQVMINECKAASEAFGKNLRHLFEVIDVDHDGFISHEELSICMSDKEVRSWFASIDVDMSEAFHAFECTMENDGALSLEEFSRTIRHLRKNMHSQDKMMKNILEVTQVARNIETMMVPRSDSFK